MEVKFDAATDFHHKVNIHSQKFLKSDPCLSYKHRLFSRVEADNIDYKMKVQENVFNGSFNRSLHPR